MKAPNVRVWLYAKGIVYVSACVGKDVPIAEIEATANSEWPTGLDHGWTKANAPFKTGEPNPSPCPNDPLRLHYLLEC